MRKLVALTVLFLIGCATTTTLQDVADTTPEPPITTKEQARRYVVNEELNTSFMEQAENRLGTNVTWNVHVTKPSTETGPYRITITTDTVAPRYICAYLIWSSPNKNPTRGDCTYHPMK